MKRASAIASCCFILLCAVIAGGQDRTALYGRVIGSDQIRSVPDKWVVRVTAKKEGTEQILDQRDSVRDLYCVRVPTNVRVRLYFETSYHEAGGPGYESTRMKAPIDTGVSDRKEIYRPLPDAILNKLTKHTGPNARNAAKQEFDADFRIAMETGSMDIIASKVTLYQEVYATDAQIMRDLYDAQAVIDKTPQFRLVPGGVQFDELRKNLGTAGRMRDGLYTEPGGFKGQAGAGIVELTKGKSDSGSLLELARNKRIFPDIRARVIAALADYYSGTPLNTKTRNEFLDFLRSASIGSDIKLAATVALARAGDAQDKARIVEGVKDADPERAMNSVVAVGEAGLTGAEPYLTALLNNEANPALQTLAANSLTSLALAKSAGAYEAVRNAAFDKRAGVRLRAIESLGKLIFAYPEARTIVSDVSAKDPSFDVRAMAPVLLPSKNRKGTNPKIRNARGEVRKSKR